MFEMTILEIISCLPYISGWAPMCLVKLSIKTGGRQKLLAWSCPEGNNVPCMQCTYWILMPLNLLWENRWGSIQGKRARRETNPGMKNFWCWSCIYFFLMLKSLENSYFFVSVDCCLSTLHALCHNGATVCWMLILIQAWVFPVVVVGSNTPRSPVQKMSGVRTATLTVGHIDQRSL